MCEESKNEDQPLLQLMRRIEAMETALERLSAQMDELERQCENTMTVWPMNPPLDLITTQFMRLEAFIVKRFPQYAKIMEASIDIPGLTGNGEVGPGNQAMPKVYGGGNATRDPHNRTIRS